MGSENSTLRAGSTSAKVICLGLDGAGKTAVLKKLADSSILQLVPTKGFDSVQLDFKGFKLNFLDTSGAVENRVNWPLYFSGVNAIVYVIDATDRRRLEETGVELNETLNDPSLEGVPLLVLANKQDIVSAMSAKQLSEGLNLHLVRGRTWQIRECSCRTGQGLSPSIGWLLSTLKQFALPK